MNTDYNKILEENKDNHNLLRELVNEVNGWDDSLESYQVYDFDDDFFDTYFEGKPEEAARATFFGNIENWMDEYIRFNGYGNLESLSDYQYQRELLAGADEIIERALELGYESVIDLKEILTQYDLLEVKA